MRISVVVQIKSELYNSTVFSCFCHLFQNVVPRELLQNISPLLNVTF